MAGEGIGGPGANQPSQPFAPGPMNTGTLADTVEQQPDLKPVEIGSTPVEGPPQSWADWATSGFSWDNLHAGRVTARADRSDFDEIRIRDGYAPILQMLGLSDSENPVKFYDNSQNVANPILIRSGILAAQGKGFMGSMTDRRTQEGLIAGLIKERRAKDPKFAPGVPDTVDGLHKYFIEQEKAKRAQAQQTLDKSQGLGATLSSFAGSAIETFHDPANIATLPVGGGGKTILQTFSRETIVNGLIEALQQPIVAQNRAEIGEELTLGDAAANVVTAGLGGGVLGSGAHAAGKVAKAAIDKLYSALPPRLQKIITKEAMAERLAQGDKLEDVFSDLSNRELSTLARTVHGEDKLTPDELAATNVLERGEEIGNASPYERTPEGDAAMEGGLAAAIKNIEDGLPPEELPAAPAVAARPRSDQSIGQPRPQRAAAAGPAQLPTDVYQGLKARGIPDHIARGAAAGVFAESRANPGALNGSSGALGYGQWLGSRKAELLRRYGPSPTKEQQLDFLAWELKGGDHGGAKVLAAKDEVEALNAYIRDFMRPAAGAETTGDLERGMAALGRGGEGLPAGGSAGLGDAGPDPMIAQLRAEVLELDNELSGMVPVPGAGDVPIYRRRVKASDALVDADRFQFKSGGDAEGVVDTLRGVKRFDPLAAGTLTFWQDRDGKIFVADGHQRSGLARRIEKETGQPIYLDGHVLREQDGVTAEMARAIAALNNIRNGSTSAIDAAKVLRDLGFEADLNLPPRSALARDAEGVARLSDPAFGMVYNELVSPEIAAVVGRLLPDKPELHESMLGLLMKLDPQRAGQAESIIRDALNAGMHTEEQINLFGSSEVTRSLLLERAKVKEKALGDLRKFRLVHKTAAENADTLEHAGSKIAREQSAKEAQKNAQAAEFVDRLANRTGPVSDALEAAARDLADGGKLGDAAARFIRDVQGLDLEALARGTESGDRSLGGVDGSGRAGEAGEAGETLPLQQSADDQPGLLDEQPTAAELEAATQRFSDPDGPAVKQQAESLMHDLRADIAADEAFQLERNSGFLVGLAAIADGGEEGQLGRYHWKRMHDPEGDWISVTIDGEEGDFGDDISHLLTKGLELVQSGKINDELAGELDRVVAAAKPIARREQIKAATAALEDVKPGEFRSVEPFPKDEPGYHRFRYVAEDGTTVGGNYTLDKGPPPFIEGFNVGDTNNPVKLGPKQTRAMFEQLKAQHPDATRIHAFRMTGARAEAGSGPKEIWIDLSGKDKPPAGTVAPESVEIHGERPADAVLHGEADPREMDLSNVSADELPALFDRLPADRDAWHDLRAKVVQERPDLAVEALDQMDRAPAEARDPAAEAQSKAIFDTRAAEAKELVEAVKNGAELTVGTSMRINPIKHDWQVRATSRGFEFRMNGNRSEWTAVTAEQHAELMRQIGKESRQFAVTAGKEAPSTVLHGGHVASDAAARFDEDPVKAISSLPQDQFEKLGAALGVKRKFIEMRLAARFLDNRKIEETKAAFLDAVGENTARDADPLDNGAAVDPAIADRQRQEVALRAEAPLRPGDVDAKGDIGLELFDRANQPELTFRLDEEGDEVSAADLLKELDDDDAAIKAMKDCL